MTVIEIKEFRTKSKNRITRKELIIKCDWCSKRLERKTNTPRALTKPIHFCSNSCSGKYKMKYNSNVRATINNFHKYHDKIKNNKQFAKEIKKKKEKPI